MRLLCALVLITNCAKAGSEGAPRATPPQHAGNNAEVEPSIASVNTTPAATSAQTAHLAESQAQGCEIVIEASLDANVYRGSPPSQMRNDIYRTDPAAARFAEGADHGAEYLSCEWRVRINDHHYRYKRASHSGPAMNTLRSEMCSDRTEAQATANHIQNFTNHCMDLRSGEYYGDILEPIEVR